MEANTLGNIKTVNDTDKEFTHGQKETHTLENGKMVYYMDKGLTRWKMETNTLEDGKMAKNTDKELTHLQMEVKYVGEHKDGREHGQGTSTWADGTIENGIWEKGELVERNKIGIQVAKKEKKKTKKIYLCGEKSYREVSKMYNRVIISKIPCKKNIIMAMEKNFRQTICKKSSR